VAVHAGVLVLVAGFLGLGWWQLNRAKSGNLLSYGYAVEWPVFAAFVIWVWIVEMRKATADRGGTEEPATPVSAAPAKAPPPPRRRARNEAAYDDSDDPELAAYNHYLAWFNANPHRTPADYPGMTTTKETS
jgi:DNA-binding transcriptional regulator of glucitol operon